MCIACEIAFMDMLDSLSDAERERILRENAQGSRFACDAPEPKPATDAPPSADERKS